MLGDILAVAAAAGLGGTGLGGGLACLLRRREEGQIHLLLSFAAGIMIGIVCFDLLAQAGKVSLLGTAAGVFLGSGIVGFLRGLLPEKSGLCAAGTALAAAIALHNIPEGMVIGAAFAGSRETAVQSGMMLAAVIGLHNLPEGMALAAPLYLGGMKRRWVCLFAALAGAPTVLGAWIGYQIGALGPEMLVLALGFASGAMLDVVFGELLPQTAERQKPGISAMAVIGGILVGLGITGG